MPSQSIDSRTHVPITTEKEDLATPDFPSPSDTQSSKDVTSHSSGTKSQNDIFSLDVEKTDLDTSSVTTEEITDAPYCAHANSWRVLIAILICFAGMISPLTTNVFLPIIPVLSRKLHAEQSRINLLVTYYMIVQGISPAIWSSIADCVGRRSVYLFTMLIFIATSIGIGFTSNYDVIAFLRSMQALGSASVIAIGAGSIADIFAPHERGMYVSMFSMGAQLGPCIGPVFAGLVEARWDWQGIFFWLASMGGVTFSFIGIFVPETLRAIVWNGSVRPDTKWHRSWYSLVRQAVKGHDEFVYDRIPAKATTPRRKNWKDIKPWYSVIMICTNLQMTGVLLLYMIVYGVFYMLLTSLSESFERIYGLNTIQISLCFLANGGGNFFGAFCNGRYSNWEFQRQKRLYAERHANDPEQKPGERITDVNNLDDFPLEKARFRLLPMHITMVVISAIVYGWTVQHRVHLAVPLVMQFLYGFFMTGLFNMINTYILDINPGATAGATAANNLLRCLFGAACSGFVRPMIDSIQEGWSFTIMALVVLLFSPVIPLNMKYGQKWRKARTLRKQETQNARSAT